MIKSTTTQAIRTTRRKVAALINIGKQSLRSIGRAIDRPKSTVHRHLKSQTFRDQYPESYFWETEEGEAWLRRMVLGVLFIFGMQHAVGAASLSDFFKLIRINTHVGVSATAMLGLLNRMEGLLIYFQDFCEKSLPPGTRKAVLAMDETFFGSLLILVLMDLSSGYLLLESIEDDRSFDTWLSQAKPRLEAQGIDVGHAISDRAKALIKLAVKLVQRADALESISKELGIADKYNAMQKFRNQIPSLATHISFWWLWVEQLLLGFGVDQPTYDWLTGKLLPVVYWHYHRHKTKNPSQRKRYQSAWQHTLEILATHLSWDKR